MIIIDLSRNIIKRYVGVATPEKITSNSETVNGTVVSEGDVLYVLIDGSSVLTPVSSTIDIREGDRVLVLLQNHEATVLGSPTSATARLEELRDLQEGVTEFEVILADKVGTGELVAMQALIEDLEAKDVEISGKLTANEASIEALEAENATINGKLTAYQADIEELQADNVTINDKLTAVEADIDNLDVSNLDAKYATIESLNAINAEIEKLDVAHLEATYAKLDFTNVDEAWVNDLFVQGSFVSQEGAIYNLTGLHLNAGDITAGTLTVDRIAIWSETDEEYYMLTPNGDGTFSQCKLDGSVIEKNSISADRIVANSITTDQITANNLVGTGGWINLAEGTFRYQNVSTNDGISWDGENLTIQASSLKIGTSDVATQSDINATQDATSELRGDLGTLQSDLNATQADITSLQNKQNSTLELVSQNTDKITELVLTTSGWEYNFTTIETSVKQLNDQMVSDKDEQYKYIRFIDGEIWIGKLPEEDEDDLQLVMRNDRISFFLNNVEIAYFSDDALYVTKIQVTNSLRIGDWEFGIRLNGNLGLRWVGE